MPWLGIRGNGTLSHALPRKFRLANIIGCWHSAIRRPRTPQFRLGRASCVQEAVQPLHAATDGGPSFKRFLMDTLRAATVFHVAAGWRGPRCPRTQDTEGWADAPDRRKIGKGIRGSLRPFVSNAKAGIYAAPPKRVFGKTRRVMIAILDGGAATVRRELLFRPICTLSCSLGLGRRRYRETLKRNSKC